jgi:hypothetical protein
MAGNVQGAIGMRTNRERFALGFLLLLGAAVMAWGILGPTATGLAFADHADEQLNLPETPETYSKVAAMYSDAETRRGFVTFGLGFLITIPATWGLFATRDMAKAESSIQPHEA